MAQGKWVSYLRVSTGRQGRSGSGLEGQRQARPTSSIWRWRLVKEFVEVESGKNEDRPVLAAAIKACRVHGAKLIIAKIDRLSRDAHFLLGLEKAGVDFVAADMPDANRLTVGIMAMIAEEESRMISARTEAALAAAKRRGVKLGGYRENAKLTRKARAAGSAAVVRIAAARAADLPRSLRSCRRPALPRYGPLLTDSISAASLPARAGSWSATQVARVLSR